MSNKEAVIESRYLKRALELGPDSIHTSQFSVSGSECQLIDADIADEAAVTINGSRYVLGRNGGEGFRCCDQELAEIDADGQRLTIVCGDQPDLPGVKVNVVYEACGEAPVLMKHVDVLNEGDEDITIDGIEVEQIKPVHADGHIILLEDDYVRDAMTIDGERVYSPWIEEHHKYVESFLNTREAKAKFAYPVEVDWTLKPGESFSSFKVFEFVVPNSDREKTGLAVRQATRELFPWTREKNLGCSLAPATDVQDYYRGIEAVAEAGFEVVHLNHGWINGIITSPLFTNYSDYELRPDLFPGGWDDVRELTGFAHDKGLKITFYSIYVNTWIEEGADAPKVFKDNDWELIWEKDDDSSRWGTTMDPASGWGKVVNEKLLDAIKKGGFDGWHLDGPYYGDISVAENRSVKPGGPNQVLGWEYQKAFYEQMKQAGIQGEAAQGFQAFAHGMSRITTTGYAEGDFGDKSIHEQVLTNRKAAYDFTCMYRPEQATSVIPVVAWDPDADAPDLLVPMEEHAEEYSAYLANVYGYGFEGKPFCRVPFEGPKSREAVQRWLKFWKDHSDYFKEGYLLHVKAPDGENIDAVMHLLEVDRVKRILVVAYNPTENEMTGELNLPLDKVGWDGGEWTFNAENGDEGKVDGDRVTVTVPAFNATWYELSGNH